MDTDSLTFIARYFLIGGDRSLAPGSTPLFGDDDQVFPGDQTQSKQEKVHKKTTYKHLCTIPAGPTGKKNCRKKTELNLNQQTQLRVYKNSYCSYACTILLKKPKHSKAQSTMPTSRDVRDKP